MKTANTRLMLQESFEELSRKHLMPFELTTYNTNRDLLRTNITLRVQEILDELFSAHLIPFELTAYEVNADGPGQYEVPFYDSRLRSIRFSWKNGESFTDVVRTAILTRLKRMSGPLQSLALTP
jgi:hypothetical protein